MNRPKKNLIAAIAASVLLVGAVAVAAPVLSTANAPHKAVVADAPLPDVDAGGAKTDDTVAYEQAQQAARDAEAARLAAEQAAAAQAQADRETAAAEAAQHAARPAPASGSGRLPSGATPPSIPGTTSPDSTACESSSVSTSSSGGYVCD